jgi:hypothetical protein
MITVRPSGLSGLFPGSSGSYCETIAGYTGIELTAYRTVSLWVKVPTVSGIPPESTNAPLVSWGHDPPTGSTHGRTWSCELKKGKPRLWIRGAHATVDRQLEGERSVVDDGEWHLLVFQFANGTSIDDVELYIDDTGPLDLSIFGSGTTINTTAATGANPLTFGARNLNTIVYTVERDIILEQIAIWTEPLNSGNISFLYNRGRNGDGTLVTGTDGTPERSLSPSALSGTIDLDAWYTWDDNGQYVGEVWDNTDNPSRRLGAFNGVTWVYDTPASGIGFWP